MSPMATTRCAVASNGRNAASSVRARMRNTARSRVLWVCIPDFRMASECTPLPCFPHELLRAGGIAPSLFGLFHRERQVHELTRALELKHHRVSGFQVAERGAKFCESVNRR